MPADERLDLLAAVSGQQQEPPEPLRQVDLDHVPQDRAAADLDQRLGHRRGALLQAGPASAAQDHDGWLVCTHSVALFPEPPRVACAAVSTVANPEIFKAYDIRGLYGTEIDAGAAELIGRAFARVIARARGQADRRSCASASAATCA